MRVVAETAGNRVSLGESRGLMVCRDQARPRPLPNPKPSPLNAETDIRGAWRSNATDPPTTDPDVRLYRLSPGTGAMLCFVGHALMETRSGLTDRPGGCRRRPEISQDCPNCLAPEGNRPGQTMLSGAQTRQTRAQIASHARPTFQAQDLISSLPERGQT